MHMANEPNQVIMGEETDPAQIAEARGYRDQFDRNSAWLQAHASEIYSKHRGKCICVAGEELFVADTSADAVAQAKDAHPDDHGRFIHYIPKDRAPRIYAY
jgi:hypothetical protein